MSIDNNSLTVGINKQFETLQINVNSLGCKFKDIGNFCKMSFITKNLNGRTIYLINQDEVSLRFYASVMEEKRVWKDFPASQVMPEIKFSLYKVEITGNTIRNMIMMLTGDEFKRAILKYDENVATYFNKIVSDIYPYTTLDFKCSCSDTCDCIVKIRSLANMILDGMRSLSVDWKK